MADRHERAALTAPDRAKLASGGEQAALPSSAITLALVAPADAKLPTPPERAPKDGTFAGFTSIKAPKAGLYTISLSSGRLGRRGPGRAFPQARGLQRRDRLRRHPQDHEIRAVGAARSCSRSAAPRTIRCRSRSCRRNKPLVRQTVAFDLRPRPAIFAAAISRPAVSRRGDPWNSASARRIPTQPTPDLRVRLRARTRTERTP